MARSKKISDKVVFNDSESGQFQDSDVIFAGLNVGGAMNFETIRNHVCRLIGDLKKARADEVNAVINMVYLNEVMNADPMRPLYFLRYLDDSIFSKAAGTISSISVASTAVMTLAADTFATGDIVTLYNVTGMTQLSNRTVRLTRTASGVYNLATLDGTAINSSSWSAGTGGTAHHRGVVLSNNTKGIISANWIGYNTPLVPVSEREAESNTSFWDATKSRPTLFQHVQHFNAAGTETEILLWFCCSDTAYHMRLWHEFRPPVLSADSDVPYLPPQFHYAIIAGAVTRLGENKTQVDAGVVWPQLYARQIQYIVDYNRILWAKYDNQRQGIYMI